MAAPKGNKNHLKHGMRNTRIYNIWRSMNQRCSNPNTINYHRYGGRGIKVCDEWKNDFLAFADWALANGYADNLTIDRKDVNGNYEPSNCRWSTTKEQQNNKRSNRIVEWNGASHTLGEWSEITGIRLATIWARLQKGWTPERALTTIPVVGRNPFN